MLRMVPGPRSPGVWTSATAPTRIGPRIVSVARGWGGRRGPASISWGYPVLGAGRADCSPFQGNRVAISMRRVSGDWRRRADRHSFVGRWASTRRRCSPTAPSRLPTCRGPAPAQRCTRAARPARRRPAERRDVEVRAPCAGRQRYVQWQTALITRRCWGPTPSGSSCGSCSRFDWVPPERLVPVDPGSHSPLRQ